MELIFIPLNFGKYQLHNDKMFLLLLNALQHMQNSVNVQIKFNCFAQFNCSNF